jgi:hypothetical protein
MAWLWTGSGRAYVGVIVGGGLFLIVAGVIARKPSWDLPDWGPRSFSLNLPADGRALADALRQSATAEARVLWEDQAGRPELGWTVLLPSLVGSPFIGGLDADGVLEHSAIALRNGRLAGRPLPVWTDAELDGYCRRYNVGWVACASQAARDRFDRWPVAEALPSPTTADGWRVYALRRPKSYMLKGQARAFQADSRRVTMTDVVPEDGVIVLSLHYQEGWRARPAWVRVEREPDPCDPIPLVRLRTNGPVGRVTLVWERP